MNYYELISQKNIRNADDIYRIFWDEVSSLWIEEYSNLFPNHGEIFLQNYQGYAFLQDMVWLDQKVPSIFSWQLESRIIGFFGISKKGINQIVRKRITEAWSKPIDLFPGSDIKYDRGYFISPRCGAPVDMNLFPQRRDINRGWSNEGKKFRAMENYAVKNPGTFAFARPLYSDHTTVPQSLEYGYFDKEIKLQMETLPNR